MAAPYWELLLSVLPDAAEAVTNFLWELGALGVVEEERPGQVPALRAFFANTAASATLASRVSAYLDALQHLGLPAAGALHLAPLEDGQWALAWREHFRPIPVGRRLVVAPPWEAPPDDAASGRLTIVIEPARAFGSGHHGSTVGCLERLEALVADAPPARVIDLGTGSGILAVAAARFGVAHVLAVDDDPDAVAAAERNAAVNGVAQRISVVLADAATLDPTPAPLVIANLLTAAHLALADRYARAVTLRGALVLGGVLDTEADHVARALATTGFSPTGATSIDGWTTLELHRVAV